MSDSLDSKKRSSEYVPISTARLVSAFVFTLGFCGFPLIIYLRKSYFKKFCDFHSRKFRLGEKPPYQIATLSLALSFLYTSIYCPIYYLALLKILGISGIFEFIDKVKKSSQKTTAKYPEMRGFDQKIVKKIDKYFKVEDRKAEAFLKSSLGDDYLFEQREKDQPDSE